MSEVNYKLVRYIPYTTTYVNTSEVIKCMQNILKSYPNNDIKTTNNY